MRNSSAARQTQTKRRPPTCRREARRKNGHYLGGPRGVTSVWPGVLSRRRISGRAFYLGHSDCFSYLPRRCVCERRPLINIWLMWCDIGAVAATGQRAALYAWPPAGALDQPPAPHSPIGLILFSFIYLEWSSGAAAFVGGAKTEIGGRGQEATQVGAPGDQLAWPAPREGSSWRVLPPSGRIPCQDNADKRATLNVAT